MWYMISYIFPRSAFSPPETTTHLTGELGILWRVLYARSWRSYFLSTPLASECPQEHQGGPGCPAHRVTVCPQEHQGGPGCPAHRVEPRVCTSDREPIIPDVNMYRCWSGGPIPPFLVLLAASLQIAFSPSPAWGLIPPQKSFIPASSSLTLIAADQLLVCQDEWVLLQKIAQTEA